MEIRRKAIRSLLEENTDLEDYISAFVIRLAEQVDHLQDAERVGALDELSERVTAMAAQADRLGFPDFARMAQKVCAACSEDQRVFVRESLAQLTELTRCIRLGHRGAV